MCGSAGKSQGQNKCDLQEQYENDLQEWGGSYSLQIHKNVVAKTNDKRYHSACPQWSELEVMDLNAPNETLVIS